MVVLKTEVQCQRKPVFQQLCSEWADARHLESPVNKRLWRPFGAQLQGCVRIGRGKIMPVETEGKRKDGCEKKKKHQDGR